MMAKRPESGQRRERRNRDNQNEGDEFIDRLVHINRVAKVVQLHCAKQAQE